jgi:hypothetical protein
MQGGLEPNIEPIMMDKSSIEIKEHLDLKNGSKRFDTSLGLLTTKFINLIKVRRPCCNISVDISYLLMIDMI